MNTDPYLATKDIEERKRIVIKYIRTHFTLESASYSNYRRTSPLWYSRTIETFKTWRKAKKEAFLQEDDLYLITKDAEERKRLCIKHMQTHLNSDNISWRAYYKISKIWSCRARETFGSWGKARETAFPQEKDQYSATEDIEEKKHLVAEHMKIHLTSKNMSCNWYRENYPLWFNRAMYLFDRKWDNALRYTFTANDLTSWNEYQKYIKVIKRTRYTENNTIESFVKEYLRLKSIPGFGFFNFEKYKKYKSKEAPSIGPIRKFFKTIKNFYMHITNMYPDIYFDPIPPYTDDDYKNTLKKAYKDNGVISKDILSRSNGVCIDNTTFVRKYGSLENACKKFGVPYENKSKHSKLFLRVKNIIEKLLPFIDIIEEKQYPWLIYKDLLSIDMFLPFFNLAIEVDGKQHYENSIRFNSKGESLEIRQARDKVKDIELPKHNITLIRIKYNEVKKIPIILKPYIELLKTIQEYCAY